MAKNVVVKLNGETVYTDSVVLKDVRKEEKCGPDTVFLGWPFLCASKMDISTYRRIASYEIDGRKGIMKALDGIPDGYIRKEYSAGFVKHLYILTQSGDMKFIMGKASTHTLAP